MFGYVKAYKPELRIKEYEMYKSIYCSVCKQIGKRYGFITRFLLSYDFTFFMLLYLSLREDCITVKKGRCVYNPLKKCSYVNNELPSMPLAASQIMLYYKLIDNFEDEGLLKSSLSRFLMLCAKKGYKKAAKEFPAVENIFKNYFEEQKKIEQNNVQCIDKAADPTAKMLSSLFSLCALNGKTEALERMGYCMGRWLYIMDAVDDLPSNIKSGKYNPLTDEAKAAKDINLFLKQKIEGTLNFCATEAAAAFELVDIHRFKNILGNIIYLGLENSQNDIFKKEITLK